MIPLRRNNGGLIKMLLLIFVVLLLLAYFRVNIRNVMSSSVWADNWAFVKEFAAAIWQTFLKVPVTYIWQRIF